MRDKILDAAVYVAKKRGLRGMTRSLVAQHADCSSGMVSYCFKSVDGLKEAVVEEAIRKRELSILADALALRMKSAYAAPADMRSAALATLATPA